jgi:superfamily II DNA helicase RecQ
MQAPAGSLLEALIAWRKEVAGGRPAYQIAKNFTLEEIARTHPKTPLELLEIHGVGPKFLSKYSKDVLELVANC